MMSDLSCRRGRLISLVVALAIATAGLGVLLLVSPPSTVLASPAAETSCDQSSLQTALNGAPGDGTPYTVTFAPGCTINVTSSLGVGSNVNVTIDGNGLVLNGGGTSQSPRLISFNDGSGASTLTLNGVTLQGGLMGIADDNQISTVNLDDSTVSGSWEAGVVAGSATITASTINGNGGAGLYAGSVTVTDSTISGNFSSGIYASGHATVTSSTVSNNGSSYGDGIQAGSMTLAATILSGNPRGNCSGSVSDSGYNLSTDASCDFGLGSTSENNVSGLDLQGLANNGGPTSTEAIDGSSAAFNLIPAVNDGCSVGAQVDQRGVSRPQGSGCDVGAYELIQGATTLTADVCPTQAVLQGDLNLASQTGGQSFTVDLPANCTIDLTSSLTIASGTDITLNGNGLTLSGGTAQAPGAFDIIDAGTGSVTLDATTLEYGNNGYLESSTSYSSSSVTLRDSMVIGNSNQGVYVSNYGSGTETIVASTISGNQGNGIEVYSGYDAASLTLVNSTISGNLGDGAYDDAYTTSATVIDSTISHNGFNGLDLESFRSPLQATVTATMLADNSDNGENCFTNGGPVTDGGYNLSTDTSCGFTSATSLPNTTNTTPPTDAQLALLPLGSYGGPTQTIALGPGSIAIDQVPIGAFASINGQTVVICPSSTDPAFPDQRGISRPQGAKCDSGAYEAPAVSLTISPSAPNGSNGWYTSDPTLTLGYSGLAIGQDSTGAAQAQVAACTGLDGLTHTATTLNDSGSVQATVSSDGSYAISCGVSQGTTALGVSYSGPDTNAVPFDLKVDTTPPGITITTPTATSYTLNQTVDAAYGCTDATSGITSCVGPVPDGQLIDTTTTGSHTFTVHASDNAGNTATKSVTYTVGYAVTSLPGSTTTVQPGYYALIRFAPEDANGHDEASRTLEVTAVELEGPSGQVIPFAYPFQYGTFSGKPGYQLELNTRNLSPGSWTLVIQLGSGKTVTTGTVTFTVE